MPAREIGDDVQLLTWATRELTPRQAEVLTCLLLGDSEKQIAHRLGLSVSTIHAHVKSLHKLFDVSSRGELMSKVYRDMLAELRRQAAAEQA